MRDVRQDTPREFSVEDSLHLVESCADWRYGKSREIVGEHRPRKTRCTAKIKRPHRGLSFLEEGMGIRTHVRAEQWRSHIRRRAAPIPPSPPFLDVVPHKISNLGVQSFFSPHFELRNPGKTARADSRYLRWRQGVDSGAIGP